MTDNLSFLGSLSPEDKLLADKITEMAETASEKYINRFTFFLDEHQQNLCRKVLAAIGCKDFSLCGGYDGAVRKVLGISAPFSELDRDIFPFKAYTFTYRLTDPLTHRDFLGSLMALGIRRDTVGDILVSEGKAVVFVYDIVAPAVCDITKVGRVGVKVSEGFDPGDIPEQKYIPIEGTVASLRLDCVLSLALRISREKAAALIRKSGVDLNGEQICSTDAKLEEGCVFSVRGFGKFRVEQIGAVTKKDRIHLCINKYA